MMTSHFIRQILSALVVFSILFSLGIYPVSVLASAFVDSNHHLVIAIAHGDIHLRLEGDLHDHDVNDDTDHPHEKGNHGIHLPRYEQQRINSSILICVPMFVTLPQFSSLLNCSVSTNRIPIIPVAPGIEHSPPLALQRTVILLI